jgi:hypothetical protein
MSNAEFPSGQWFGFYTYHGHAKRFLMDLVLEFNAGKMTGEGADGIGPFVISGQYSQENGECSWVKQYVGRHSVDYKGFREGKDIWGTWTVLPGKGGFKIWPLGEGEALREAGGLEKLVELASVIL